MGHRCWLGSHRAAGTGTAPQCCLVGVRGCSTWFNARWDTGHKCRVQIQVLVLAKISFQINFPATIKDCCLISPWARLGTYRPMTLGRQLCLHKNHRGRVEKEEKTPPEGANHPSLAPEEPRQPQHPRMSTPSPNAERTWSHSLAAGVQVCALPLGVGYLGGYAAADLLPEAAPHLGCGSANCSDSQALASPAPARDLPLPTASPSHGHAPNECLWGGSHH